MKIECVKEKLQEAVSLAEKITGKNLTLPILSCLTLEVQQSNLLIKSTNLDMGFELSLPVKVLEPGAVSVPGSIFSNFLTNLQDEKVFIENTGENLNLSTKKTSTTIKTLPVEEFPIIPRVESKKGIYVDAEIIVNGLKSVWYSSAVTSMKPELSSVYIYSEDEQLVFVATDSFRLAEKKVSTKKTKDFGSVLIPYKNIPEIIRILETVRGETEILIGSNQIAFKNDNLYLVSRVIDGTFPDYKQIVPREFKTEVTILKQDLLNALKLANVFSDTFNQVVFRAIPGEKLFELTTKNSVVGENHNSLDAVLKGEDLSVSFNYKYIIDCFQSIHSDSLSLSFQGLGKPVLIRGVSDRTFSYIVMPMNK